MAMENVAFINCDRSLNLIGLLFFADQRLSAADTAVPQYDKGCATTQSLRAWKFQVDAADVFAMHKLHPDLTSN